MKTKEIPLLKISRMIFEIVTFSSLKQYNTYEFDLKKKKQKKKKQQQQQQQKIRNPFAQNFKNYFRNHHFFITE